MDNQDLDETMKNAEVIQYDNGKMIFKRDEGVNWMSTLLSSPLFEFIPPTNIQTLFSKSEEQKYDVGDVVIMQGEPGDYSYAIESGIVKVERTVGDPKEVETNKRTVAVNVPQLPLRKNLPKLKTDAVYVNACDGGKCAALAAYTLNEKGFSAYVLQQDNS
jgi:CRP-like cAMP-binding protein